MPDFVWIKGGLIGVLLLGGYSSYSTVHSTARNVFIPTEEGVVTCAMGGGLQYGVTGRAVAVDRTRKPAALLMRDHTQKCPL
jgi:hypothetical protein